MKYAHSLYTTFMIIALELQVNEATKCIALRITPGIFLEGLGNMKKLRCLIVNYNSFKSYYDYSIGTISNTPVEIEEARLQFPNSLRYLYWYNYPHWCLPKTFEANNLVSLEMRFSKIKKLWEGGKVMKKLKFLDLSYSMLRSLDLGLTPKLERLNLEECCDLVKLDVGGGCLKSLVYLNLGWCSNLRSEIFNEEMESLEFLNVSGLDLREFPGCIVTGHSNDHLLELNLSGNEDISEIPSSIGNLHNLVSLHLSHCYRLKSLPGSICSLQHLTTLNLGYTGIEELPEDLGQLECLEYLDLSLTEVKHLPSSICMLKRLETLILKFCYSLEKLPEDVGELESLEVLHLEDCSNLREIPSSICKLKRLKELNLRNCSNLREIPSSICKLKRLWKLDLEGCKRIKKLPEEMGNLECLKLLDIRDTGITHLPLSISTEHFFVETSKWSGSREIQLLMLRRR
ncbi:uncharacterized protein LOC143572227 [Bidens hawaiensis]|uniref:uncharacterized protein LOC143572227 n=1 Tax=Bidens hawaiensis TaxID=980011 RepID=UPI00404A459A